MSTDAIHSKEKNSGGETQDVELVPTPCLLCQQFYCICYRVSCSVVLVLISYKLEGFDVRGVYLDFLNSFACFLSFLLSR